MSRTVMLLSSRPRERSVICRRVLIRFRTPLTFRWLRQEFDLGGLGADDLQNLAFTCFHDEDCEIYLNAVLASGAPGCTTTYVLIAMNEEARRVLHPNGKNLIAVHCHQTEGGQFIDVGISKRVIMDDSAAPRKRLQPIYT